MFLAFVYHKAGNITQRDVFVSRCSWQVSNHLTLMYSAFCSLINDQHFHCRIAHMAEIVFMFICVIRGILNYTR